jgi:hypothetical protein
VVGAYNRRIQTVVGSISGHERRHAATRPLADDPFGYLLDRIMVPRGEDDSRSAFGRHACRHQPDAARRTGNHYDFVFNGLEP